MQKPLDMRRCFCRMWAYGERSKGIGIYPAGYQHQSGRRK